MDLNPYESPQSPDPVAFPPGVPKTARDRAARWLRVVFLAVAIAVAILATVAVFTRYVYPT